ncbi:hypothetical protein J1N35_004440 [Gossypium stocksii]|uniref:Reverse transcriptase domain-containing protein n=1 Tax=Gossypium stocksii TaxID=47602 RepID=A0A9D4AI91_9ROSI|nr:hypothetical protein J1N35_004440 [Gossypium stocksii]
MILVVLVLVEIILGWQLGTLTLSFPLMTKNVVISKVADANLSMILWTKCIYMIWVFKVLPLRDIAVTPLKDLIGQSISLKHQEFKIREELKSILYHEEIFLRQKSRCEWLKLGDRNTSYFYRRTIQRRKFNKITALRDADGDWVFDPDMLKSEVVNFFQNLYGEDPSQLENLPHSVFPSLSSEDVNFLGRNVTNKEIKAALFDMAPFKTLGSDGFQAGFFQNQWDNVGGTICEWVKNVFGGDNIDPGFNNTLIVLIPTVQNPKNFSQFRPISLCSVLKLVMKVIANRFKSIFLKIIGQEQAGFIASRSIIDNVIIAQEVLHSKRTKKKLQWMAIKIDLEKAYDRVR